MPEEIWKPIEGYEGDYEISNLGRIKSLPKKWITGTRILKPGITKGYYHVSLYLNNTKTRFFIHRLVAKHFLNNPNKYEIVNHINGVRADNTFSNLEWCTQQQNIIHSHWVLKKIIKKVLCIDTNTIYPAIIIASRELNISANSISAVAAGKRKTAGGKKFKYI